MAPKRPALKRRRPNIPAPNTRGAQTVSAQTVVPKYYAPQNSMLKAKSGDEFLGICQQAP